MHLSSDTLLGMDSVSRAEETPGAARLWGDIRADCHKHIPCPPESSANVGSGTRVKAPGLGSSWKPGGREHILAVREAETSFQGRYRLFQSRTVCPEYVTLGEPCYKMAAASRERIHCDLSKTIGRSSINS